MVNRPLADPLLAEASLIRAFLGIFTFLLVCRLLVFLRRPQAESLRWKRTVFRHGRAALNARGDLQQLVISMFA